MAQLLDANTGLRRSRPLEPRADGLPMNFYQHQDRARRKTALLVLYFLIAVVLIAAAINAVVFFVIGASTEPPVTLAAYLGKPFWLWVSVGVIAVIGAGTAYTTFRLRGGGSTVAEMVGARRIDPDSADFRERQLVNVVDEMSIASGTPVPALYVMDDEPGINAFVAGTRPSQTVLVVTRGALEAFSRDELQGVVAHEYSHIFNNDMSINIRLMGVLAGILLIGQVGRFMLRSGTHSRGKGSGQAAVVGLAVLAIGYIGLFFGSLIKAAISRQREFLADASAVQFTRNPDGIAGALFRIREHVSGSLLDNAHSEDVSHFCFGESVRYTFSSLLATHPPLEARIHAIDPRFEAERAASGDTVAVAATSPASASGFAGSPFASGEAVAASVGTVTPEHVALARRIHDALPAALVSAAHRAPSARQIVYGLILCANGRSDRVRGLEMLEREHDASCAKAAAAFADDIDELPARARLPVLNMTLAALRAMDESVRHEFRATVKRLVEIDRRYTIFEFALVHVLDDQLAVNAGRAVAPKYFRFADVESELALLLSVLARVGTGDDEQSAAAFARAWEPFGIAGTGLAERDMCSLSALTDALAKLELLSPLLKRNVISACADCVIHDGRVTAGEAELLQVIAIGLDCPMPPLLGV